jgi:hypothetical protein
MISVFTKIGAAARRAWLLPLLVAFASLWPLVQNAPAFRELFYFEDEWDLIDLWDRMGFGPWCTTVFAENFVPLFKLLWGGAIVLCGGNYFALVIVLWLTHAANVFLLVRISRRLGADAPAAALAGLIFGLTAINYETLTWTVQWSAVLSLSFLLLGLDLTAARIERTETLTKRDGFVLGACALASALCFSRGVLAGFSFAVVILLASEPSLRVRLRLSYALIPVVPALAVAAWIFRHSTGNHQHLSEAIRPMLSWSLHYYAQSPLRVFFSNEIPPLPAICALGALKSGLFIAGVLLAPQRARAPLLALAAFEIGSALLLGLGRYHTGIGAAASSRYQYGALATLLPFCAIIFSRASACLARWRTVRFVATMAAIVFVAWRVQLPWRETLASWTPSRGGDTRAILFGSPPAPEPEHLSRLPWMTNERAHVLVEKYHLH